MDGLNRRKNRPRLHDHTGATSIGIVVDDVVFITGIIAYIMQDDAEKPSLLRAFQHAFRKRTLEHIREQGENIEMHTNPGCLVLTMLA